jgi:hypothetical protein
MQGQTPSATYIKAFCDAMNISSDWLLSGEGPRDRGDIRSHALKNADASELLIAIAETLSTMNNRIETMERFMLTLSNKSDSHSYVPNVHINEANDLHRTEFKMNTQTSSQSDVTIVDTEGNLADSSGPEKSPQSAA